MGMIVTILVGFAAVALFIGGVMGLTRLFDYVQREHGDTATLALWSGIIGVVGLLMLIWMLV